MTWGLLYKADTRYIQVKAPAPRGTTYPLAAPDWRFVQILARTAALQLLFVNTAQMLEFSEALGKQG